MVDNQRRPSIAMIFNPKKAKRSLPNAPSSRAHPSVVVTDEDTPGDSVQLTKRCGEVPRETTPPPRPRLASGRGTSLYLSSFSNHSQEDTGVCEKKENTKKTCPQRLKGCICSVTAAKIFSGIIVLSCVTSSWVGSTHLLKDLFLMRTSTNHSSNNSSNSSVFLIKGKHDPEGKLIFNAPFFATWFCTAWTGLFFPLYLLGHVCLRQENTSFRGAFKAIGQNFRDRGVTFGRFFTRCLLFCFLWVGTNYLYINSLRILDCTDVLALYSAHIAFVYLLAWVILHEQFVGVRIVAVIMCNTGIALLAYMDGITKTKVLLGVVFASASAAGTAVYKVLFKKVVGDSSYGQVGVFFTCIAFLNTFLLSPVVVALLLLEYETILWANLPWPNLLLAALLHLVATLLGNFGLAITFEIFITLGIIICVPVSGALDVKWYGVVFEGMKLAGIVLIVCGFFLVLFPANWPHYISTMLRWCQYRRRHHHGRHSNEPIDYRTGLISRSHLRSPSGLIR